MKTLITTLALAAMLASGAASAAVTVQFLHPEKYTDLPWSQGDREEIMQALRAHFTELGRNLPAGTDLQVDVLDIDLAGNIQPTRRGDRDLRIMRGGADWPRMTLHYALVNNGSVVRSGDVNLQDMDYQHRPNRRSDGDPLRYEKGMIDDWFYAKVALRRPG